MDRHSARRVVLELLYEREFSPEAGESVLQGKHFGDQAGFVRERFAGVVQHLEALDAMLAPRTRGWRYERISLVDRNILRLGAYELLFAGDLPAEAALDEAVELCKAYGTERCSGFVNGILDRLWKERGGELDSPPPATG